MGDERCLSTHTDEPGVAASKIKCVATARFHCSIPSLHIVFATCRAKRRARALQARLLPCSESAELACITAQQQAHASSYCSSCGANSAADLNTAAPKKSKCAAPDANRPAPSVDVKSSNAIALRYAGCLVLSATSKLPSNVTVTGEAA